MALIKYIGKKPSRADTVAGTKTVWTGHGDVQEVPDIAVPRLLFHADIWELAKAKASPAKKEDAAPSAKPDDGDGDGTQAKFLMQTEEGALVLDDLDKDTLRKLAKELELKIHHTKSEDHFREELAKAFPVTGG